MRKKGAFSRGFYNKPHRVKDQRGASQVLLRAGMLTRMHIHASLPLRIPGSSTSWAFSWQQAGSPQHRGKPGWQPWALLAATGAAGATDIREARRSHRAGNRRNPRKPHPPWKGIPARISLHPPRRAPSPPRSERSHPKKSFAGQKGPCLPAAGWEKTKGRGRKNKVWGLGGVGRAPG